MCTLEGFTPVYTLFKMRSVPGGQVVRLGVASSNDANILRTAILETPSDRPRTYLILNKV